MGTDDHTPCVHPTCATCMHTPNTYTYYILIQTHILQIHMCTHMYTQVYTHLCTHVHASLIAHTTTHMRTHIVLCARIQIHTCVLYAHPLTCVLTWLHVHTHKYAHSMHTSHIRACSHQILHLHEHTGIHVPQMSAHNSAHSHGQTRMLSGSSNSWPGPHSGPADSRAAHGGHLCPRSCEVWREAVACIQGPEGQFHCGQRPHQFS